LCGTNPMAYTTRGGKLLRKPKLALMLYHFTQPGTYWPIAVDGIEPSTGKDGCNEHMSAGVPVVWLTTEESNVVTAADIEHMNAVCKGGADREVGDINYGGTLRLTVRLKRSDQRLIRYNEFLERSYPPQGLQFMRRAVSRWIESWLLYSGTINFNKIDPISAADYIDCLNHHIETHPDLSAREMYAAQREQLRTMPPDTPIRLKLE
jgi:hypothetical protein